MNQYLSENPNIRISSLFQKALKNFRLQLSIMLMYGIFKVVTSFILTCLSISNSPCQWELIDYWLIFVGLESACSIWCFYTSKKIMQNLGHIAKIAEDLHQVIYIQEFNLIPLNEDDLLVPLGKIQQKQKIILALDFPQLDPQEESKKIINLTSQIKFESSKKDNLLKWVSHITFLVNQGLIIFGFVIEFNSPPGYDQTQQDCKYAQLVFLFIFLVISVYQYIDLYVIIALILICLPFILCFLVYYAIKQCQQKRKTNSLVDKLLKSDKQYAPGVAEGDPECRICLQTYNIGDKIISLPCNNLHHFHSTCISAWLKVSPNCPMCRMNFADQEDPIQQLQQPLQDNHNIQQEL